MPTMENDGIFTDQLFVPGPQEDLKTALNADSLHCGLYKDGPSLADSTTWADLDSFVPGFAGYEEDTAPLVWIAGKNDDGENILVSNEVTFQADSVLAEPYDEIQGAFLHSPDSLLLCAADFQEGIIVNHPHEVISGRWEWNLKTNAIIFIRSSL